MKLSCALLIILVCASAIQAEAQQPIFRKLGDGNTWLDKRIYDMAVDDKGFLWICTPEGLCRYDGRQVKTFDINNSPVDYGAFHLYKDANRRMWVLSIFSPPVYIQDGVIHVLDSPASALLKSTKWIAENSRHQLHFFTAGGAIYRWDSLSLTRLPPAINANWTQAEFCNDSIIAITNGNEVRYIDIAGRAGLLSARINEGEQNRIWKIKPGCLMISDSSGLYQYTAQGMQLLLRNSSSFSIMPHSMLVENDSTIWIGSREGIAVFRYNGNDLLLLGKMLPGKNVISIIRDKNGNLLAGTYEDGVYVLHPACPIMYRMPGDINNSISQVIFAGNTGYLFTISEQFRMFDCEHLSPLVSKYYSGKKIVPATACRFDDSSLRIRMWNGGMGRIHGGKVTYCTQAEMSGFAAMYYRNDGAFYWTEPNIFTKRMKLKKHISKVNVTIVDLPITTELKSFCVDYNERCWIGYNDGLYCYETDVRGQVHIDTFSHRNEFITDIQCDSRNKLWVATKGGGIYLRANKKIMAHYTTANGLNTNNYTSIYIDTADNIWCCSESGLALICQDGVAHDKIQLFTESNILPDNRVNSIARVGNNIYIATHEGLVKVDYDKIHLGAGRPVPCYITNVALANKDTVVQSHYTLPYGTPISIGFSSISYDLGVPPVYSYNIGGRDTGWSTTTADKIQYEQLPAGNYTFVVYANNWKDNGARISITVLPPYWQRWWFVVLVVAGIMFIAGGAIYLIVYYKNKRSALKRKMIENDLRSLKAQINPHFIFNALNSIQDFILHHQPRSANHYLSRFAALMRMIVDNSRKELISLHDEVELLQLYLQLEQLRLGTSFSFSIVCQPGLDTGNTAVPSMLLQPVIENAIVHGLPMKTGAKELQISFAVEREILKCTITDNGIGRKKAAQYNRKQGASMGLSNITERLQLVYEREHMLWVPIKFADAGNSEDFPGTRVTLYIPLMTFT